MRLRIGQKLALASALPAAIILAMIVGGWLITGYLGKIQDEGAQEAAAALEAEAMVGAPARLYQIIADGVAAGVFAVDDLDTTLTLIHSCLTPRDLDPLTVENFLVRALSKVR